MFSIIEKNGKQFLSNDNTSADCATLFKIVDILNELSEFKCEAEFSAGILWLEDGSTYNILELLAKVSGKE
jgi:hypothetical protein